MRVVLGAVSQWELVLLCAAALGAGVVDAIAGGGGLVTVPALMTTGLPTHVMLGTNKGQSVFGSGAALVRFARAGLVDWKLARWMFPLGFLGAAAGVRVALLLRAEVLKPVVLVLLVGVALFLTFRKPGTPRPVAHAPEAPAARAQAVAALVACAIGFYDGFFGPGTGTFLIIAFAGLLAQPLQRASANAKVVNFASNLASVLSFALAGKVVWAVALPMAAAQFTGGWVGAHLAVKGGDTLVRKVVLLVVVALVVKNGLDLVRG